MKTRLRQQREERLKLRLYGPQPSVLAAVLRLTQEQLQAYRDRVDLAHLRLHDWGIDKSWELVK